MGERRGDTRERIQAVALDLFAERGYERTSLREIAERLDVTKAALYYHFKTKEDIVVSLFDDLLEGMDTIISWGRERPCTQETREELVRRYARLAGGRPPGMMRFVQENRATMRELAVGEKLHERFRTLTDMVTCPDASLSTRLMSAMALITFSIADTLLQSTASTAAERQDAAVEVALELVSGLSDPIVTGS